MSHVTTYECDECGGVIDSSNDGIGFFRVTPPFWDRELFQGEARGSGDIELCSPVCAAKYFGRIASHKETWDQSFKAHIREKVKRQQDANRMNQALQKVIKEAE